MVDELGLKEEQEADQGRFGSPFSGTRVTILVVFMVVFGQWRFEEGDK